MLFVLCSTSKGMKIKVYITTTKIDFVLNLDFTIKLEICQYFSYNSWNLITFTLSENVYVISEIW